MSGKGFGQQVKNHKKNTSKQQKSSPPKVEAKFLINHPTIEKIFSNLGCYECYNKISIDGKNKNVIIFEADTCLEYKSVENYILINLIFMIDDLHDSVRAIRESMSISLLDCFNKALSSGNHDESDYYYEALILQGNHYDIHPYYDNLNSKLSSSDLDAIRSYDTPLLEICPIGDYCPYPKPDNNDSYWLKRSRDYWLNRTDEELHNDSFINTRRFANPKMFDLLNIDIERLNENMLKLLAKKIEQSKKLHPRK